MYQPSTPYGSHVFLTSGVPYTITFVPGGASGVEL